MTEKNEITKRVRIIRGEFHLDGGRIKTVGENITLSTSDADRYIKLGLVCEPEQAPGYKKIPGETWVRLKAIYTGHGTTNQGRPANPGDVISIPDNVAARMIYDGYAERLNPANKINFNLGN